MSSKRIGIPLALIGLGAVGALVAANIAFTPDRTTASRLTPHTAALVNGTPITTQELDLFGIQGSPAERLDAYVDVVAAAEAARSEELQNQPEVKAQIAYLTRQTLADHWLRAKAAQNAVNEEAVKSAYDQMVADKSRFREAKVSYFVGSPDQAQATAERIAKGDLSDLHVFGASKKGEPAPFLPVRSLPYQLGNVVIGATPERPIGPLPTREGWMVLYVHEFQSGPVPALEEVEDALRRNLTEQFLADEIKAARQKLSIVIP